MSKKANAKTPQRISKTPHSDVLSWLEQGQMRSDWERSIVGAKTKRRLEVSIRTTQNIKRSGKILEELGRKLQLTAQYRESHDSRGGRDERVKVLEASYALHTARQALKEL